MVDLDSNPTKLIEIVEIGKQMLITRGSLTTFSIANDVAKYFAIIPAMFAGAIPGARQPQHHAPRQPAERDPLGRHLQRARDRGADPARAARRALPARVRRRDAAPQPAHLRRRRRDRAVHRHQADRPRRRRARGSSDATPAPSRAARFVAFTVAPRASSTRSRSRASRRSASPTKAERLAVEARRRRRRLEPDRPDLHRAAVLPPAPVGRRRRLRRDVELGLEPRALEPEADRRTSARGSPPTARRTASPPTRRCRSTPSPSSGSGLDPHISVANARIQAAARRRGRATCRSPGARARRRAHRRPVARLPRRARRQRARAQPRARRVEIGQLVRRDGTRNASHLPRRRARRRQDVRDARRGPPPCRARHRRRRRLRRDPRPPEDRRADRRPRGRAAPARRVPRARRSRRWTSTRSSRAGPQVALVDELAHTNVPGSRHEKRWEDVEALLDAGITVISTLNIQHLESVNDVVEQITGIKQQETIPDAVVRRADQIELVDMAPEAIRRRMAHGNIYPRRADRRRARQLLPHRATSARCESSRCSGSPTASTTRCCDYRERHGIDAAVGDAGARRRRADRLRRRRPPRPPGSAHGGSARRATSSPSTCGRRTGSPAAPRELLDAPARARRGARRHVPRGRRRRHRRGARRGCAARSTPPRSCSAQRAARRFAELTRGSVINRVIRDSGVGLDVHVISRAERRSARHDVPRRGAPAPCPGGASLLGFLLGAVGLPLLTWVLTNLRTRSRAAERPPALPAARGGDLGRRRRSGRRSSAAVVGFLLVNWYFTPPVTRSRSSEGENLLALVGLPRRRGASSAPSSRSPRVAPPTAPAPAPRPRRSPGLARRGAGAGPARRPAADPRARRRRGSSTARRAAGRSTTRPAPPSPEARGRRAGRARRRSRARRRRRPVESERRRPAHPRRVRPRDHVVARARGARRRRRPRRDALAAAGRSSHGDPLRRLARSPHAALRRSRRP